MLTKLVSITQFVWVTIDETKFDQAFLQEFRDSFYRFHTIDEHLEHLAQLAARGIALDSDFIEGYGSPKDMGIAFEVDETEVEILPDTTPKHEGGQT